MAGYFRGDFSNADLRGASLAGVRMGAVDFTGADLTDVNARSGGFWSAVFKDASLAGADLADAMLLDADMSGARLSRAIFTDAQLERAALGGADLRGALLDGADFTAARIDCKTRLPKGFDVRGRRMIPVEPRCGKTAQNRDFSEGDWSNADFSKLDLSGARFRKARLLRTNFTGADLRAADFSEATDEFARFHGADLTGASFRGSSLHGDFFSREERDQHTGERTGTVYGPAKLDKADFTDAAISAAGFLGDELTELPNDVDISTAIFERTKMKCSGDRFRRIVKHYNDEDGRKWRPDPGASEEIVKIYRQRREEDYRYALAWLDAEGALVRSLAAKWPTMTFGKECQAYFGAPE